MNISIRSSCDP